MPATPKPGKRTKAAPAKEANAKAPEVPKLKIADLQLDSTNPRFGGTVKPTASQVEVLDTIVDVFGVDDLLSSLSVNGYFGSEPLVGYKSGGKVVIAEGNRRLAACLILEGDPRAVNHEKRTKEFAAAGRKSVAEVPVLVYPDKKKLLSFIGVRHIAAQNPWDSYAKAHWVAEMLDEGELSLQQIASMIGDQYGTVARLVEGYYLANQLTARGRYDAGDSKRAGRGSNPAYPFSWIYTALGYTAIREWLGLGASDAPKKNPLAEEKLADGAELLTAMFGSRARGLDPRIEDSREISDLALVLADPKKRAMFRAGASVGKALKGSRPLVDRVEEELFAARDLLKEVLGYLGAEELDVPGAQRVQGTSKEVKRLAKEIDATVIKMLTGADDDE